MYDDTDKVQELVYRRRAALLAGDAEALAALLHAEYRYVDSLGRSLSREVYLTSRRSGELVFDEQVLQDLSITPLGEHTAMVTVTTRDRFRFRGEEIRAQYRAVHVCVKSGDGWLFLFGQSTPAETTPWSVRRLHALDDARIDDLAGLLIDCVEGGASVSFMHPLTRDRAAAFWRRVAEGVAAGERALLVAEDDRGVCGTVQLILDQPENQPHRADLAKMLVHRRARRRGLGEALIRAAETTARECGKTLLVLDTVTGSDAARLYERLGWQRVGEIPGYALLPRGGLCGTTVYYRALGG